MAVVNHVLDCGDQTLFLDEKTIVMGVINVTPDSYSDGGRYLSTDDAIQHGLALIEEGADILDIGGVATSPQCDPHGVSEEEELRRVMPVINGLVKKGITQLSVDTSRARVAMSALDGGASWINDQSGGLGDPLMPAVMAKASAVVIMHQTGSFTGVDAGEKILYDDVMTHLLETFRQRFVFLEEYGVQRQRIVIDPGIGFGKGLADSLTIINNMRRLSSLGVATLLGLSRKSFLFKMTGIKDPVERDYATLGAHALAILSGANILRTHNVRATKEMAMVLDHCIKEKYVRVFNDENLY